MAACFFYGTLMHPAILSRVIARPSSQLHISDAILLEHTRHYVQHVDYPAVVPLSVGRTVMRRPLTPDESCVRGTLVQDLTDSDVAALDEFEGDEYTRADCTVVLTSDPSIVTQASVYLWAVDPSRLLPQLWSFEDFVRDHLKLWINPEDEGDKYAEVDRRRAMAGKIEKHNEPPIREAYGHALRDAYWNFEPGFVNLNHGSFGTCPDPVMKVFRAFQDVAERAPDKWFKRDYVPHLDACRTALAELVNCDMHDLVMVNNATSAIYNVIHSLRYEPDDCILYFPITVYNACGNVLLHLIDTRPHLRLTLLPVAITYPCSDDTVVSEFKKVITQAQQDGKQIRAALFDAISSSPGVRVPWERLASECRKHSILSVVDAAHALGQIPVDLREAKPDFWVSNAHKWLYAHRACAMLYVDKEHQHYIHSVPVGHAYPASSGTTRAVFNPTPNASTFESEFAWSGTQDFSSIASIGKAISFRRRLGGERAIQAWCHSLAQRGGQLVAEALGTEVMENQEGSLTAAMVNIRFPVEFKEETRSRVYDALVVHLIRSHWNLAVHVFVHNNTWWIRLSAQVYNELNDFKYAAVALVDTVARLRTPTLSPVSSSSPTSKL